MLVWASWCGFRVVWVARGSVVCLLGWVPVQVDPHPAHFPASPCLTLGSSRERGTVARAFNHAVCCCCSLLTDSESAKRRQLSQHHDHWQTSSIWGHLSPRVRAFNHVARCCCCLLTDLESAKSPFPKRLPRICDLSVKPEGLESAIHWKGEGPARGSVIVRDGWRAHQRT